MGLCNIALKVAPPVWAVCGIVQSCTIAIVHRISHGMYVVVVSIQSKSSKFFLLFADWLFTTTTFVPWDILWAMTIAIQFRHVIETCRLSETTIYLLAMSLTGASQYQATMLDHKRMAYSCSTGMIEASVYHSLTSYSSLNYTSRIEFIKQPGN